VTEHSTAIAGKGMILYETIWLQQSFNLVLIEIF